MFGMLPFDRRDDNLFDAFDKFFGKSGASLPDFRTDIREDGDKYILDAELPGFAKEDIDLDVKDGVLTISAKHEQTEEEKDSAGNYLRRERRFGSFSRSFDITGIDEAGICAAYNNGVLTLTLPKIQPVLPVSHKIAIQ